jgi:abortive infection bacteriophage resistance protein
LIGLFLIAFSKLENELNTVIAAYVNDRTDEVGFVIIEKITMGNKIDLFYKLYLRNQLFKSQKYKLKLIKITNLLKDLNLFRNIIVHANWESLSKDGYVRSKIVVDNQEGYVKFKRVKVLPKVVRQKIKEADKLIDQLYAFQEDAFQEDRS